MSKLQRYSSYKDSGVAWLGDIPQGWEVKKLKHILKFTTGATPSSHSESYYNGEEPWVTISDMDGRYIQKTHFISKSGIRASNMSITPKNSLLYSFKLSVGQVAFNTSELYTNEAIASFHPAQEVNLNFWYYALPIFVIKNANTNIY
jgi:type I restriction enzyme, S subunit